MAEYIDRDKLSDAVRRSMEANPHADGSVRRNHHSEHLHFLRLIDRAPTADVVEVVRCGQCVQWDTAGKFCHHPAGMSYCGERAEKVGFCYFGERRDDHAAD